MSTTTRALIMAVGVLFIVFALVVAVYAGEPFNIATLFGLVGIAMIVKLYRERPSQA